MMTLLIVWVVGWLIVGGLIILLKLFAGVFLDGIDKVLERRIERNNSNSDNDSKESGGLLWKILRFIVNIIEALLA